MIMFISTDVNISVIPAIIDCKFHFRHNLETTFWSNTTPCLKKLCKIVFVTTLSNFNQSW